MRYYIHLSEIKSSKSESKSESKPTFEEYQVAKKIVDSFEKNTDGNMYPSNINYILKVTNQGYIVSTTNYLGLDDCLLDIEEDLRNLKYRGLIIFDLLSNNGHCDRYFQADFDGNKFDLSSLKNINNPF